MRPAPVVALMLLGGLAVAPARAQAAATAGRCAAALRTASAAPDPQLPAPRAVVGPLRLGMPVAEVERLIGAPVADTRDGDPGVPRPTRTLLFAFAAAPGPLVRHGAARFRLAALSWRDDRLVRIDNQPAVRIDDAPCAPGHAQAGDIVADAPAGPLLRFSGIRVGDPLSGLRQRFGRMPDGNASHDWYSLLPLPISFDVDPDRATVSGFAIATDADTLTRTSRPLLRPERDPGTCRLRSIRFQLASAG